MSPNRIPKKVYLCDRESSTKNSWSSEVKSILTKCDQIDCFRENTTKRMNVKEFVHSIKQKLLEYCATKWKIDVEGMPKLRTYVEIRDCYCQEPIVCKNMSSKQRAVISKMRSGTLPGLLL
jgi:preprotein translocase subunit SecA